MTELGNRVSVETAVKHGSDIDPQAAFKNLNSDLTQAENLMSRQEYVNYLERVRIGLTLSGALPDLSITWAEKKVKKSGPLTREQLVEEGSGNSAKTGEGLNTVFANEVGRNFDTFKNANFERDTYGHEKNFITGADIEQVRRQQNFYREKETDLHAYAALASDHRRDYEKQLSARIDGDSQTILQPGEGLWAVASRVLKQGGDSSDNEHVARYAEDLKRWNAGKKMEPGTAVLLTHFDTQETLYDIGMEAYRALEQARLYDNRKTYASRVGFVGFDSYAGRTSTVSGKK
jgi:hypothetical protein